MANAQFTPYPIPLDDAAVPVLVARYDPKASAGSRLSLVPYVRCTRVEWHEGSAPPSARFEYVFDDSTTGTDGFPDQFEQVWPIGATNPAVIRNDDRLCVYGITSSGVRRILWDGFAQIPQVDVSPTAQAVTFVGVGTPIRAFDSPIQGAYQRNADDPDSEVATNHVDTDLPTRFNPDTEPNKTPTDHDINEASSTAEPTFLDSTIARDPDPRAYWTLGAVCRYLMIEYNDETYVKNPNFLQLDSLLTALDPQSSQFINGASIRDPIVVRDYDATGKAWPDALAELLGWSGFAIRWDLSQDGNDEPVWKFAVYRKDSAASDTPKSIMLQPAGSDLDPGQTNIQSISAVFDSNAIANRFVIETHPIRYEISVILAPAFELSVTDADPSNLGNFRLKSLDDSDTNREKYRVFIADEAGDGHWDFRTAAWVTAQSLDLSDVLGKPSTKGVPAYVTRHRPGKQKLFSIDGVDTAFKASLEVSLTYPGATKGKSPGLWDGTATDWTVVSGGWRLLPDQLGIEITADDPNSLALADAIPSSGEGKKLSLIERLNSANGKTPCYFRLTTVIEGDRMIDAVANKRTASPTQYAVTRRIDAKDHFKKEVIAKCSMHNSEGKDVTSRDDTALAVAHAEAMRSAHEFPPLAASVTIPWLCNGYAIGDRIDSIDGRDVSLQTNAGAEQGESPYYPTVVGRSWTLHPNQATTLTLGDRRMEPHRA